MVICNAITNFHFTVSLEWSRFCTFRPINFAHCSTVKLRSYVIVVVWWNCSENAVCILWYILHSISLVALKLQTLCGSVTRSLRAQLKTYVWRHRQREVFRILGEKDPARPGNLINPGKCRCLKHYSAYHDVSVSSVSWQQEARDQTCKCLRGSTDARRPLRPFSCTAAYSG